MPFQFRFKSLVKHRDFLLREARGALGAAQSAKMKVESEIEQLRQALHRESTQFEDQQREGISSGRYGYFKEHLALLELELRQLLVKLEKASAEVDTRKLAVVECDKSVKTLESIETRDRELYKLTLLREEQKKLDYAAVLIAHRKTVDKGGNP
ncbi:MAG: flagellar export protein FliJ [Syntrophobacteraceae bacterium]|nr:flagellar export protein FliJ [Syntrophobacteraceae bacterium]